MLRVRFCNRTPKDGKSGETLDAFEKKHAQHKTYRQEKVYRFSSF